METEKDAKINITHKNRYYIPETYFKITRNGNIFRRGTSVKIICHPFYNRSTLNVKTFAPNRNKGFPFRVAPFQKRFDVRISRPLLFNNIFFSNKKILRRTAKTLIKMYRLIMCDSKKKYVVWFVSWCTCCF